MSERQHVVSQFYLRNFSENGKSLNVFNLKRGKAFLGASLKRQCYGRNVYGDDLGLEKVLMDMEGDFARVISHVLETKTIPLVVRDYCHLARFVGSQILRPAGAIDQLHAHMDMMAKHLAKVTTDRFSDEDLSKVRIRITNPGDVLLDEMSKFSRGLLDLMMILVVSSDAREFVTSDNPVVVYNTFTEVLPKGQIGGNGIVSVGAQIFVPLSPRVLLALYDDEIYAAHRDGDLQLASDRDVDTLNLLQSVFAKENLYFLTAGKTRLLDVSRKARPFRVQRNATLTVMKPTDEPASGDEKGQRSEIVMFHTTTPNISLGLDFLRLRKAASRIPIEKRYKFRPEPPYQDEEDAERDRKANLAADELVGKRFKPTETTRRRLVDE